MKKSRKLLCMLLALVMVVSLLPVMAFAADEDVAAEETTAATVEETSPETEGVITDVIKNLFAKLPNYLVAVKTSDGRVAAGAQVVIYNQNKDQVATAVANYGVAIFAKKDHLNTSSVHRREPCSGQPPETTDPSRCPRRFWHSGCSRL